MNLERCIKLTTTFLNNNYNNMWSRICYTNKYNQTRLIYKIYKKNEQGWCIEDFDMCDILANNEEEAYQVLLFKLCPNIRG
jgi:hypothetical protein